MFVAIEVIVKIIENQQNIERVIFIPSKKLLFMFSSKTNTDMRQEKVKIKVKKMAIKVTIVSILDVEYFVLFKPSSISKSDLFK